MPDLDFTPKKPNKCKNCGYDYWKHKADTFNCPANGKQFTWFYKDKFFESKEKK